MHFVLILVSKNPIEDLFSIGVLHNQAPKRDILRAMVDTIQGKQSRTHSSFHVRTVLLVSGVSILSFMVVSQKFGLVFNRRDEKRSNHNE